MAMTRVRAMNILTGSNQERIKDGVCERCGLGLAHPGSPMRESKETVHRLSGYSDAFFAVIVTIMVLELKAPEAPAFSALWALWPTMISYAVSYLFITIIWINHHHLMRFVNASHPPRAAGPHKSMTMSRSGREQHTRRLPSAGLSRGSGS